MQLYIEKSLFFLLVSAIATAVILLIEKLVKKKEPRVIVKHIFVALFIVYALILLDTTVNESRHFFRERMIDFTPFDNLLRLFDTYNPRETELLLMNIIMFTPFGILFPLAFKKHFGLTILISILFGSNIECMQYVFIRGVFEFDVVVYRTIGVIIGYLVFCVATHIMKKLSHKPIFA